MESFKRERGPAGCENHFEKLGDDVLQNILDKLLFSPFEFGANKACERLRLEAVCKRFQRLVRASANMQWSSSGIKDKQGFLHYMQTRDRSCALKRVALDVGHPVELMATLQLVMSHAQNSLEELHLFLELHYLDRTVVMPTLQACKKLTVLIIIYWSSRPLFLVIVKPLKPFALVHSLSLYGLALPSLDSIAFFKSFPSLKSLETHQPLGASEQLKSASCLEKFFSWGNFGAGFDHKSPSRAMVPPSLEMLVGLLNSRSVEVQKMAAQLLRSLSVDVANQLAIAKVPGSVERLVSTSSKGDVPTKLCALIILQSLAGVDKNRKAIAAVEGCLTQLAFLISSKETEQGCKVAALNLLQSLACHNDNIKPVTRVSGMLRVLVGLFGDWEVESAAAHTLHSLTRDADFRKALARSRSSLKTLASVLVGEHSPGVQTTMARILICLARDGESTGAIEGLHVFLRKQSATLASDNVVARSGALSILGNLATNAEDSEFVASVPGCLEGLLSLLERKSVGHSGTAAFVLLRMTPYENVRKLVVQVPKVWDRLVALLLVKGHGVQCKVANVLFNLAIEADSRKAMASVPECLAGLATLAENAQGRYGDTCKAAIEVVLRLLGDKNVRDSLSSNPGTLRGLAKFSESHNPQVRWMGAWALSEEVREGEKAEGN